MKKNFVRLAAFLAAAGIITGCSAGTSTGGAAAAGGGEKPRTEAAAGGGAFAGETQSVIDFSEEPYEVSIHFIGLFEENKDVDKVEAALNEITVPQINAKIDIVPLFIGNLVTTTSLGVAGDEKLDIVAVGLTSPMDSMVSDDLLLPLDELLQERGQDALRVTADVAKAQMINGKTYALSGYPYPAKAGGFVYNKTMADEFGIDMHDEMTMEEYTEVAKILKEKGIYFTTFGSSSNVNYKFYNGGDYFGTTGSFGGILKPAEETTVINVFDSQEMRDYFKTIKSWFDSGYTPSDQLTDTTRVQEYFAQQKIFGSSTMYTPGQITSWLNPDFETGLVRATEATISTASAIEYMLGIAANCKRPDKAMDVINLIYGDREVANLLQYGVEGLDYVAVAGTESVITTEGTGNEDRNGYFTPFSHFGNPLDKKIMAPLTDEYYSELTRFNEEAEYSKTFGYFFDATAFRAEAGAIASILEQKLPALNAGQVSDVDAYIDEMVAALNAAGMEDAIKANQESLDQWLRQ